MARIVIGQHQVVRMIRGSFPHHFALALISVAAAPEYAPDLSRTVIAQSTQNLLDCIRCVRKVDNNCRFACRAAQYLLGGGS